MAQAPILPSGSETVDYITMTSTMIASGQAQLTYTPRIASKTLCEVIGGLAQMINVDFTITGNIISWQAMGLQTILGVGDTIRVVYFVL